MIDSTVLNLLPASSAALPEPTVFEIALQRKLALTIKPAFDFAFQRVRPVFLCACADQSVYGRVSAQMSQGSALADYHNEAYFVLSLFLQRRSLKQRGTVRNLGTMADLFCPRRSCLHTCAGALLLEILYGLQRCTLDGAPLTDRSLRLSLLTEVRRSALLAHCAYHVHRLGRSSYPTSSGNLTSTIKMSWSWNCCVNPRTV